MCIRDSFESSWSTLWGTSPIHAHWIFLKKSIATFECIATFVLLFLLLLSSQRQYDLFLLLQLLFCYDRNPAGSKSLRERARKAAYPTKNRGGRQKNTGQRMCIHQGWQKYLCQHRWHTAGVWKGPKGSERLAAARLLIHSILESLWFLICVLEGLWFKLLWTLLELQTYRKTYAFWGG